MLSDLKSAVRPTVTLLLAFTVLLGVAYPLAVTGAAQILFPHQAGGSLIERDGRVVGSALIGQAFTAPGYFHGRPSAAGKGYDATASSGSNYGPGSKALADRIAADVKALRAEGFDGPIPVDLVTASGSGLDPDISPAAALAQVPRIARARGMDGAPLRQLVEAQTEKPFLALFGEPRVNVLLLNRQFDGEAINRQSDRIARKPVP